MDRRVIGDGTWFNADKAQAWDEGRRWDGRNHISLATGSQWEHERLYRTSGGVYVLHSWSQWQGSGESYSRIDAASAARWLVQNEHGDEEAKAAGVASAFDALEVR